jgi:hypothetical protein
MDNLDENLNKAFKIIKETRRMPTAGIWYYVWLKPKWELVVFPALDENGEKEYGDLSHLEAWMNYLVPRLVSHYKLKLSSEQLEQLTDAYRGVPRGRVDISDDLVHGGVPVGPSVWFMFHGNDFPKGKSAESELGKIMSELRIAGFAASGKIQVKFSDHETMVPEHQVVVQQFLGELPY